MGYFDDNYSAADYLMGNRHRPRVTSNWEQPTVARSNDPYVCSTCGGRMSDPRPLGSGYIQSCTNCGARREIPAGHPIIRSLQQQTPYPELLQQVGEPRAMLAGTDAMRRIVKGVEKKSDYNGWTNWDTWNTNLMLDNEQHHQEAMRENARNGGGPEGVRDYALRHVIGPHNRQAIQDAQEWNSIPEHDRLDHHYEELKDKSPQAADIVNQLGFGPDVSDSEPTLIDPELVNWDEIHGHHMSDMEEEAQYEREQEELANQGLTFGQPGRAPEINHMMDAWMKYHGAQTDADRYRHRTLIPIDQLDPNDFSGGDQGQFWRENVVPNGGYLKSTNELGSSAAHALARGQATPEQAQTMQAALEAQGHAPEAIQHIMRQRFQHNPETGRWDNMEAQPQQPDPSLDQPGDLTLPDHWAGRRRR